MAVKLVYHFRESKILIVNTRTNIRRLGKTLSSHSSFTEELSSVSRDDRTYGSRKLKSNVASEETRSLGYCNIDDVLRASP